MRLQLGCRKVWPYLLSGRLTLEPDWVDERLSTRRLDWFGGFPRTGLPSQSRMPGGPIGGAIMPSRPSSAIGASGGFAISWIAWVSPERFREPVVWLRTTSGVASGEAFAVHYENVMSPVQLPPTKAV